jgi:hypothetical protein
MGVPSKLNVIRKADALERVRPTLILRSESAKKFLDEPVRIKG